MLRQRLFFIMQEIKFKPWHGKTYNLATNENHLVFRWIDNSCLILFSVCKKGDSASCHFYSNKPGLRKLKRAINDFCEFLFYSFDWCKIILANTFKSSGVGRLISKVGFIPAAESKDTILYVRLRDG